MQRLTLMFLLVFVFSFSRANDEKKSATASLKSVTIYRSGAEMTHMATAQLSQGSEELTIENISNQVDVNSIQINCPAAVTIMGVEFSNNYLLSGEQPAIVKMLEDSVEKLKTEIGKIDLAVVNASDVLQLLKENRNIKSEQTGMSVSELMKLVDYYRVKTAELQNEIAALQG